ncbi:Tol-Pal system beta propeller repeat protein TolB [Seohaeicola saemankumensis]|uniref:Tol-Pal system beta propeller repeat protein TolB n=1 Tax=Seohaeicola saemankumensis TaxID=481181 RepID=UPI001E586C9E|nr:Tol-Pal system beta propeller repeat protein TolB [Seohaeicola saemankumensis]MCD1625944.1 Tol-Pal system beta propeller repeat protein TolB [Seohaeicola saemankumensis]
MTRLLTLLAALLVFALPATAQNGPLRIEITEGVIEPLPFANPAFVAENAAATELAQNIARVVSDDLIGTGLFREIPPSAFISQITSFNSPVQFADWRAINAQALISGAVSVGSDGSVAVKFRLYDVFAGQELGEGLQFNGTQAGWRRMAHKVADAVYSRITGEGGYFDSRVVYVAETGPKDDRRKRLAIMDYDGANVQYLTDSNSIVLAPRFSPTGDRILYTSYESGFPRIYVMDVASVGRRALPTQDGTMSFAPRFAPDGNTVVYSLTTGGNTDIYRMDVSSGNASRLTSTPSIETAPSFSPDGSRIVFESDRSGTQQLYIMGANGGEPQRISFGQGRYGTPVWSPRGDLIAFTKQSKGRFHIGVMRTDGSEERLLTASFLDEGPTWSPNGRVIMFTRETQGEAGAASLYSVDISGRNLKQIRTEGGASDPAWSPLQR